MSRKGAVAAGHIETAKAAATVLEHGGNAFDAVVAAHFAACIAEPVLSSPGGGGFLLARTANQKETLYDFFVQTPLHTKPVEEINFYPITADFGTATQQFHVGPGSVATPGTIHGLCTIHKDLCTMPLKELVAPAIELAKTGLALNKFQAEVLRIIEPIYMATPTVRKQYESRLHNGSVLQEGEVLQMEEMVSFFEAVADEGSRYFYEGDIAQTIVQTCNEQGGYLRRDDFSAYKTIRRKPLRLHVCDAAISVNPPPSSGGLLALFGLKLLEKSDAAELKHGSLAYLKRLTEVQALTEQARTGFVGSEAMDLAVGMLGDEFIRKQKKELENRLRATRGTTHISIADSHGNLASLTTSNGEGSGVLVPGTGIMLNNMLGEEDLNPSGFHEWHRNQRMTSMMAPGILSNSKGDVVFGSGGSNRIRTALLQVMFNLLKFDMTLEEAIRSPRLHHEKGLLNIEHGFDDAVLEQISRLYPSNKRWETTSLYFGGVHAVRYSEDETEGFGDPRRGGVSLVVG